MGVVGADARIKDAHAHASASETLRPQLVRPKDGGDAGPLQVQAPLVLHVLLAVQVIPQPQGGLGAQPACACRFGWQHELFCLLSSSLCWVQDTLHESYYDRITCEGSKNLTEATEASHGMLMRQSYPALT